MEMNVSVVILMASMGRLIRVIVTNPARETTPRNVVGTGETQSGQKNIQVTSKVYLCSTLGTLSDLENFICQMWFG